MEHLSNVPRGGGCPPKGFSKPWLNQWLSSISFLCMPEKERFLI